MGAKITAGLGLENRPVSLAELMGLGISITIFEGGMDMSTNNYNAPVNIQGSQGAVNLGSGGANNTINYTQQIDSCTKQFLAETLKSSLDLKQQEELSSDIHSVVQEIKQTNPDKSKIGLVLDKMNAFLKRVGSLGASLISVFSQWRTLINLGLTTCGIPNI